MRKYLVVFRAKFQQAILHRAETVLWLVMDTVPLLVLGPFWVAVYRTRPDIAGYTVGAMVTYYMLGRVVEAIVTHHFDNYWEKEIRTGAVARLFVKPISFVIFVFVDSVSSRVIRLILFLPMAVVVIFLFSDYLLGPLVNVLWLLPFIAIAYLIDYFLVYLITVSTFWLKDSTSLSHAKWMLGGVVSGAMIPLAVLPAPIQKMAAWLPFRFLISVPVEIYLGRIATSEVMRLAEIGALWVILLAGASKLMWGSGIKKFSAAGG